MNLTRKMRQQVTHWPVTGSDGYGGFTFGTPVMHLGRWEEKNELFLTPDNEEVVSMAICYLNTDVSAGDYLAQGDHATIPVADPLTVDSHRIRNYGKSTDLRAVVALRKAWM
jgi:hypothetical protein